MLKPQIPDNELERQLSLENYQILDALPDKDFDDITRLASLICGTPISLISIIDNNRQFFKSKKGLQISETPRDFAFCAHAINKPTELMIVEDSRVDERFFDNPLVTGYPNVVFYAGVPLVNSSGHALGTLCVIDQTPRDLRDEQKMSLKALANQVTNLLELRLASKINKEQERILLLKNKEIEETLYSIAHDLNSPLQTIEGLTNLIAEDESLKQNTEILMHLDALVAVNARGQKLVSELLNYTKLGVSKEKELVDTGILINQVIQTLGFKDATSDKAIIVLPENMPKIMGYEIGLSRLFQNLISNAFKFIPHGIIPHITISIQEMKQYWMFAIDDNGIGIDNEQIPQLFKILKRLHTKEQYPGTGLGLATCKKIVEQHDGKIWVQSIPNKGSTFFFTLIKA